MKGEFDNVNVAVVTGVVETVGKVVEIVGDIAEVGTVVEIKGEIVEVVDSVKTNGEIVINEAEDEGEVVVVDEVTEVGKDILNFYSTRRNIFLFTERLIFYIPNCFSTRGPYTSSVRRVIIK